MNYADRFIELYQANIKRKGSEELLEYLKKSDFFTAPASTRFHLACEGGLVEHSVNVYLRLKSLLDLEYGEKRPEIYSDETVAICGLLHDVCKIGVYAVSYRNVKENGIWKEVPFYTTDEQLPYGHGEKSVYIINGFLRLTREEALAINWHMGSFDDRVRGGSHSIAKAYADYPIAVLTHLADLSATYLDENRNDRS
ncbi:MAG TPA: hydrolase [Candidatus Stercoripulliclostridium merdipullorum]|uniref:Hydrolase n=1 Tax=Candidatus Stercoripulliclostridium merdipullorum TaxID=2840952 RepID=A0A9D1SX22_9FIRM|nr:hydrolase [Candidatus Stercoripulliclostridium merdipullorum]